MKGLIKLADNMGILINTSFNIDRAIESLKQQISKQTLTFDVKFDTKQIDNFKTKIDSISKSMNGSYWQGRFNESIKDMTSIDSELTKMKQFYKEQEKVASATEKRIQKESQVNNQLEEELSNYKKYASLQTQNIGNRYKNVSGTSDILKKYNDDLNSVIVSNGKLINSNTGAETSFGKLRQGLSNARVEIRNSQNAFSDFKDNIEKFGNFLLTGTFMMQFINNAKMAVSEINNLSDAITDLHRVSDATQEQLNGLDNVAFKIADNIGGSAKGIVDSMTEFSKIGYDYQNAMSLSQDASKYATAGWLSNEEATQSLIATYQVFGNTFDSIMGKIVDSQSIIDAFNSVGKQLLPSYNGDMVA